MTQTIYKYPLKVSDEQTILLPKGAQMLTVQIQNGQPCLWVLIDPSNLPESRKVFIRGTAQDVTGLGRYISTFQIYGGDLVFHVFEG